MSQMKNKILHVFSKHSKATKCCSVNSLTADCKCCKLHNNTHGQHKTKQWKSRKERNQMRRGGRQTSDTKLHHHHQNVKNSAHIHSWHHRSCFCTSRKEEPYQKKIAAAQKPSIITDNRLIGHQGLFNHEVKSVDIERLLSEQKKPEKSEQQVPERSCTLAHPSSTPHNPSPYSSKDWAGSDANEAVQCNIADPAGNSPESREKEKKLSQGSDVTPGQSLQPEHNPSSGSSQSIFSSKHSSLNVVAFKNKKYNSVKSERCTESPLSPTGDIDRVKKLKKTHMISTPGHTPKQEKPAALAAQASSSPITQSFNVTHIRQDPQCVWKSVSKVAARLCDCLQFPDLRRRNLVTESREEVVRALREQHGPHLRENLLKLKRSFSCGADPTTAMVDDDDVLFPEETAEHQTDNAVQFCFHTQRTHRKTPEWLTDPMDTSTSLLGSVHRSSCSPPLSIHGKTPEVSANDYLFSHFATSCWGEKSSSSQHWGDSFSRSTSKDVFLCCNSYPNLSSGITESCRLQHSGNNIQPFLTHTAQLTDRHSAEPRPFLTDRCSNYQSFSGQSRYTRQSDNIQRFSQFTERSPCPPLRPHNADMMLYPPSHMLERDTAPPLSSLPSPEPWSFPPMRLY